MLACGGESCFSQPVEADSIRVDSMEIQARGSLAGGFDVDFIQFQTQTQTLTSSSGSQLLLLLQLLMLPPMLQIQEKKEEQQQQKTRRTIKSYLSTILPIPSGLWLLYLFKFNRLEQLNLSRSLFEAAKATSCLC